MQPWIPALLFSTVYICVNGECCPRTLIGYLVDESEDCDVIPGGQEKEGIDPDPRNELLEKLDRKRPRCYISVCNDGTIHDGFYCGIGSCNMFGCNCDGACFGDGGNALENFRQRYEKDLKFSRVITFSDSYRKL